jgi:mono/diheme cytochrome c family protein
MRKSELVAAAMWLGIAAFSACGGEREAREGEGQAPAAARPPAAVAAAAPAPAGPVDQALAERGERVFQTKGCVGCHTIGKGRLTGPDLKGVTERRPYEWFVPWVMNPDSMLKVDPIAKQLLAEYMTPMLGMGVTADEARALWEYLRHESH